MNYHVILLVESLKLKLKIFFKKWYNFFEVKLIT
jgi:hypothetical protein